MRSPYENFGTPRFELGASPTPRVRATGLRHVPLIIKQYLRKLILSNGMRRTHFKNLLTLHFRFAAFEQDEKVVQLLL